MARAILIDLDGVIRRWPASDEPLEKAHGLPSGALREVAFSAPLVVPATLGQVSDERWRESVVSELRERFPDARSGAAVAAWSASAGTVDRRVLDVLAEHAPDARLVLVTNATSRLDHDLEALGIAGRFHAVVNSSAVGVRKPALKALHLALQAGGVTADEALYVDDSARNVEAADALGIAAHRFVDVERLADFLRSAAASGGS